MSNITALGWNGKFSFIYNDYSFPLKWERIIAFHRSYTDNFEGRCVYVHYELYLGSDREGNI
jgi:hypothetical protein